MAAAEDLGMGEDWGAESIAGDEGSVNTIDSSPLSYFPLHDSVDRTEDIGILKKLLESLYRKEIEQAKRDSGEGETKEDEDDMEEYDSQSEGNEFEYGK